MNEKSTTDRQSRCCFLIRNGRVWFTARAERRFYFVLTVLMLTAGILYKLGVL